MNRVVIVDDDPFIRDSLEMIINLNASFQVVYTCANGDEAFQYVQENHEAIDIVLMDIRMPICDGVEGTKKIKQSFPHVAVMILTTFDDDDYIVQAIKHGANGYLLKNIPPDQIIQGISSVLQGNLLIHPHIAKKISSFIQSPVGSAHSKVNQTLEEMKLTSNEQKIVEKIADGYSNKEIASALFLSEGTVKNYISDILHKLKLRDRTQIAIFYLKQKI
ncbi:response regulator transcription factor [Longirhabdus pacifica]|uniref:response regulator transcription factor n=1 Tax=Longirhabdus pacifica TaxID=2305227 RepID=UPI001008C927|nr:response regulator transcription factor [Longirhabdus pacifica]